MVDPFYLCGLMVALLDVSGYAPYMYLCDGNTTMFAAGDAMAANTRFARPLVAVDEHFCLEPWCPIDREFIARSMSLHQGCL